MQQLVRCLAICMSLFHLYTGFFGVLESIQQRGLHLAFAMVLIFLIYHNKKQTSKFYWGNYIHWVMILWFICYVAYYIFNYKYLVEQRFPYVTDLSLMEILLGIGLILALLEASRRTLGSSLAIVAVIFIAYALLGPFLPGMLHHDGLSINKIIDNLAYTTEGIYGEALAISATYIFLFVLFGAFLEHSGLGNILLHLATGIAGRLKGGPAKIAVLSSAFMGSISGSAVANVTTTGTLTIPLMKRIGYSPVFAGAVEAVSSTGGQILPPVMGSAAFIMVQFTGIPYITIISYALVPALLFYLSIWVVVDYEASRLGLVGLTSEEVKGWRKRVLNGIHLLLPIFVLLALMIVGFSPMTSVVYSILSLVLISYLRKNTRLVVSKIMQILEDGAKLSLSVVSATAVAGIIVGMVSMTGIGHKFSLYLTTLSGGNIYLALILTMLGSIILGMGLPTVPAYLVQVSLTIPALVKMGVPLHVAHLFTMYYACLSMITPPVAMASYAAAALSGASASKTGWVAARLAIPAFVIPFAFAIRPGLLLSEGLFDFVTALIIALIAGYALILLLYSSGRSTGVWLRRVLYLATICLVLSPEVISTLIGILLFLSERIYTKRQHQIKIWFRANVE